MLLVPARGHRLVSAPPSGPSASLRRHKFRVAYFRLAAKMRSLHCASSPHKISDFAGTPLFPDGQPSRFSPIARLVRRLQCKFAPHHGQQEGKRSNGAPVLASQFSQAVRRTIGSAKAGSSCLLPIRQVKQDPPRPERQIPGSLGVEPLSALLPTFPAREK